MCQIVEYKPNKRESKIEYHSVFYSEQKDMEGKFFVTDCGESFSITSGPVVTESQTKVFTFGGWDEYWRFRDSLKPGAFCEKCQEIVDES